MNYGIGSAMAALAVVAGSLWAHHSVVAQFDYAKKLTLTGRLTKVDWRNPHIEIFVEAKGDLDKLETWGLEGWAPNAFRNASVGKADFHNAVGQPVTVEGARARDGSAYLLLGEIKFADGRSLKVYDLTPPGEGKQAGKQPDAQ